MGEGEVVLLLYKKLLLSGIIIFSQRNDIQMLVYRLVLADADEDCRKRRIERWLLLKNVAIMFIDSTADAFVYLYFLKNVFRYIVNSSGI